MVYLLKFNNTSEIDSGLTHPCPGVVLCGTDISNYKQAMCDYGDDTYYTINFDSSGNIVVPQKKEGPANNEIWYTSTDGNVVTPYSSTGFGANIVSNVYSSGKGVITFDGDVTSTGNWAFDACSSLVSIILPISVASIGYYAFNLCTSLISITLPISVTSVGACSFLNCASLTSVTIPDSVTLINEQAFTACQSLTTITYLGTISQWNSMVKYSTSTQPSKTFTINCTDGTTYWVITYECFVKGTKITLSDGTKKNVEDLTYSDILKVWNADEGKFDTADIVWLTQVGLMNGHYYKLTFSDGTVLKVTGQNSNHKMYNVDTRKFEGCAYAEVGDRIYSENGIVTLVSKEYIEEEVEYVNVITDHHINCFAEGILTSDRYGNTYPHDENMKYVKDGREIRPYSEFEAVGISEYWYNHLRLGEQTETLEETQKYIAKIEGQMRPLPTE